MIAAGRTEVDRIAASCEPSALAELVTIASGAFDPPGTTALRCRALTELRHRLPLPRPPIWDVTRRYATALDSARPAVLAMLDDDITQCGRLSPRKSMVRLLIDVPLPSVRSRLEKLVADDAAAGVAIRALDEEASAREGSDARLIDTIIAPATPAAFEDLIQYLVAGASKPDEGTEFDQHVERAFSWLYALAQTGRADEPTRDKDWRCQQAMRAAIQTGTLGQDMLSSFERLTLPERSAVLETLRLLRSRPRGVAPWAAEVAAHDPDPQIRADASTLRR